MLSITLRVVMILLPVCAMFAGAVLAFGQSRPLDTHMETDFGLNACALPCWAGIVPGETSFDEVPQIIAEHLTLVENQFLLSPAGFNFWLTVTDKPFSGFIVFSQGAVGGLSINAPIPIGYLLARLGRPDCIYILENIQPAYSLHWENDALTTSAGLTVPEHWQPETQVNSLWMRNDVGVCSDSSALAWQGFAPLWQYQNG